MQAAKAVNGGRISAQGLATAAVAVAAAALLATGAYVKVASVGAPAESPRSLAAAAGDMATSDNVSARRGGTMWIEGPVGSLSPIYHAPGSRKGGSQI
jgi:hypothetical protein